MKIIHINRNVIQWNNKRDEHEPVVRVDDQQKMYYNKARWLLDNNYIMYDASWRAEQL